MNPYQIMTSLSPDREVSVVLTGPGIEDAGRHYVFASSARCESFIEAVNFAYEQGVHDGMRRSALVRCADSLSPEPVIFVTGRTPEDLSVRPERWWERLRRRWRGRRV